MQNKSHLAFWKSSGSENLGLALWHFGIFYLAVNFRANNYLHIYIYGVKSARQCDVFKAQFVL